MVTRKMVRIAFVGQETTEVSQGHQGTRNRLFNVTSQLSDLACAVVEHDQTSRKLPRRDLTNEREKDSRFGFC